MLTRKNRIGTALAQDCMGKPYVSRRNCARPAILAVAVLTALLGVLAGCQQNAVDNEAVAVVTIEEGAAPGSQPTMAAMFADGAAPGAPSALAFADRGWDRSYAVYADPGLEHPKVYLGDYHENNYRYRSPASHWTTRNWANIVVGPAVFLAKVAAWPVAAFIDPPWQIQTSRAGVPVEGGAYRFPFHRDRVILPTVLNEAGDEGHASGSAPASDNAG